MPDVTKAGNTQQGSAGLPPMPDTIVMAPEKAPIDWKRIFFILLGIFLFALFATLGELAPSQLPSDAVHDYLLEAETTVGEAGKSLEKTATDLLDAWPNEAAAIASLKGAQESLRSAQEALSQSKTFAQNNGPTSDARKIPIRLSRTAQLAIGLFLMAGIWWVFEVVPIGVTSIMIGTMQVLFSIRPASQALSDFLSPPVWFIFGSLVLGTAFTKSGLTKRMAYKMLNLVGEKTSMIMLGCFVTIALMTHLMAHTAVAAAIFPLLMAIHALYTDEEGPTKFGQALFIGMAWVAGAGSICTFLGAARGVTAVGFFKEITGMDVAFFELSMYMMPVGWIMVFLIWGLCMIFFKPEKPRIENLRERVAELTAEQGPMTKAEWLVIITTALVVGLFMIKSLIPADLAAQGGVWGAIKGLSRPGIILISTLIFYVSRVLTIDDLEEVPWNIILLFGGAMSIGYCLWQTGAAVWLAAHWLNMFESAPPLIFVLSIAFLVLMMTNFIMNVAAIAICLPVALVVGNYLGVNAHVILFASLVTAGMPFILLIGAAPNAIAYESKHFTTGQFFTYGWVANVVLMLVLTLAIVVIWPLLGLNLITG